jgi:membrane fusion protein (multidrug efflux system)
MPDDHSTENPPAQVKRTGPRFPAWAISLLILLMAGGVFFLVYGNWNEWESGRAAQSTDDAYIRADVTALSTKASGLLLRMAVSDYQHVAAGQLIASIRDDDYLAQQDAAEAGLKATEAELPALRRQKETADSKIQQANAGVDAAANQIVAAQAAVAAAESAVHYAESALGGAQAQFQNATQEVERQEALFTEKAATLQKVQTQRAQTASARALFESRQLDVKAAQAQLQARMADVKRAQSALDAAKADVSAAVSSREFLNAKDGQLSAEIAARLAAVHSARIAVGYTRIVAPSDGYISSRNVLPGQIVTPGTTVVSLVEQAPWIQANFKETQLTHLRAGNEAEIKVDTFPGRTWKGHVLLIAPVTGAQTALLPPDNATGNFTKIVQRIPVKITLDPNQDIELLRPGMSVTVTVKTGKGA